MQKGGDGSSCDGRSTGSGSGDVNTESSARVEMKGAAADNLKSSGEGGEQASSSHIASSASTFGINSATDTAAPVTTTRTVARLGEEADVHADDQKPTDVACLDTKDGGERGKVVKEAEAGHVDSRSGCGSNRAQRTCRRLALKRIRQYVGYFEEDAATPTAADDLPNDERALFKDGKSKTATPSTGVPSLRSSSSSRTRRTGPGIVETPSTGGIRQRGRFVTSPDPLLVPKQMHSRGEREPDVDAEAPAVCNSPVAGINTNEETFCSCENSVNNNEGCTAATPGTSDDTGTNEKCPVNEADSALDGTGVVQDNSLASTTKCVASSAHSHSGCDSSGGHRCRVWTDENGEDGGVAALLSRTESSGIKCGADTSTLELGDVRKGDGTADTEAAEIAGGGSPEMSTVAAKTARRLSTECADGAPKRLSSTLHSGPTTDPELQEHQQWKRQQRLIQQDGNEGGKMGLCSSDDVADTGDQILKRNEKPTKFENEGLTFCNVSAPASSGSLPPATKTLPSNIVLSPSTVLTPKSAACGINAASLPATLTSPTACAQQHAANLNALMVKSVSPAGVVRRGGRNRRKRTKYDLAYRQMEQLGPFAEEAKTVELSKVSGSSFAVELLKNPELYSYEAWSHGFAWPVGADGRRLLLRKLRGVYWSDPEYWQQRLMSEGLYRRDLFTLATVQELFKVTHLMGPGVWDFLLKCTALTHKCDALTAKDSDQTDGEDGGCVPAHGSSPEALSPHAGPRPVTPTAAESSTCSRKLEASSRGTLLPGFSSDHQMFACRERVAGSKSFRPDTKRAEGCSAHSDTAAAVRALAAAAGAPVEDPVSFSSWLRATTAGVTTAGENELMSRSATDGAGMTPEEMLLFSHAGAVSGGIEQSASKSGNNRTYTSFLQMKKPSSRAALSHMTTCEPERSGLQLDLSTQEVLDAVAAAVEAAAVEQSSHEHSSQTALVNRNTSVPGDRGPYLAGSSDIAAVLAAARNFQTAYDCPSSSSSSASQIDYLASSKESDALDATDTQPAAAGDGLTLPCMSSSSGPPFERAGVVAFGESGEDSAAGSQQQLSAAAAAAAAADWLGSLQQLLPPVLHDSAQCEGTHVSENILDTSLQGDTATEATSAGRRFEFSCPPRYTSLSVFDSAGDVTVPSTSGTRMADKLLELLAPSAGNKRSSAEVHAMRGESSSGKATAQKPEDGHTSVATGAVAGSSSFGKEEARKETEISSTGTDGHPQGFEQHYATGESQEEVHGKKEGEEFVVAKIPQPRGRGRGSSLPGGGLRADTSSGAEKADTNEPPPSAPALGLELSTGDYHLIQRAASDSSCSTCLVTSPSRARYNSSSRNDIDLAAGTAVGEARRLSTAAYENSGLPCQAALRNITRLMATAAAAATTETSMSRTTAATPAVGGSTATGVSARLDTVNKCWPDGVKETSIADLPGDAITGKTGSDRGMCSSLELLQSQQQQDQQSRTMNNLMLTLATVLQQQMAPQSTESVTSGKSTGGSDTVSEDNAQRLLSMLQTLNQHLERQQKKPVTNSFPPFARPASLPGYGISQASGLAHKPRARGRSPHLDLQQAREGVQGHVLSDKVEGERTQPCKDRVFSDSCQEMSGRSSCTGCGARSSEEKRFCRNYCRTCRRQIDKPSKGMDSESEPAPLAVDNVFTTGLGDITGIHDLCATTHSMGEEPLSERPMQETASAPPGDIEGESQSPKESATRSDMFPRGGQDTDVQRGSDSAVQTGGDGGGVQGSLSERQLGALRSSSLSRLLETAQSEADTTQNNRNVKQTERTTAPTLTGVAGELHLSSDFWFRCMQAMGSSLTDMKNRLPRTPESCRRVEGAYDSASGGSTDFAGPEYAASARTQRARVEPDDENASNTSKFFSRTPPQAGENDSCQRRVSSSYKESPSSDQSGCQRCLPSERPMGPDGDVNLVFSPTAGRETSGALLLRALRAHASSAVSATDTATGWEAPGSSRSGKNTSSNATNESTSVGDTSSCGLPRATGASCWHIPRVPCRGGDTNDSSGEPPCSRHAYAPFSAASLLQSTHALLQLKTHYDFMAQFMQCMMLLEVQQALVGLLQSLRRNNPGTSSSNSKIPSSSSSSTVRRTRRMQRRSHHGRKRKISFFSSGNETSCESNSEPGLPNRSLRGGERFAQSRRRRRRIDAVVNHVPPESVSLVQKGEGALERVSAVVPSSSHASQCPGSALVEGGLSPQKRQPSTPETHTDRAEAPPEEEVDTSEVVPDGKSDSKGGCSNNSIQATSTCSSSSAYSSVGRHRHKQSPEVTPCRGGRDHDNSDVDASGSSGSRGAWTTPEGEKGVGKDRRNSTNSSRSRSVSCPRYDDGEDDDRADINSGSLKPATCSDGLYEEESGSLRDSNSRTSPAKGGLHADQAIKMETFLDRDATIQSCLQSLVESLKVQMKFVHVMAGHLQEHVSTAAAQEEEPEDYSDSRRRNLPRLAELVVKSGKDVRALAATVHVTNSADVSGVTAPSCPKESLAVDPAPGRLPAAVKAGDGERGARPDAASKAPELREDDAVNKDGDYGGHSPVALTLFPVEGMQQVLKQNGSGTCEKDKCTRRNSGAESRSRRGSWTENVSFGNTDVHKKSLCSNAENLTSTTKGVDSVRDEATVKSAKSTRGRCRENSASGGTILEEGEHVGDTQPPAEIPTQEEALEEMTSCVPGTILQYETALARRTREGEKLPWNLPEKPGSALAGEVPLWTRGASGRANPTDLSTAPASAEENTIAALAVAERSPVEEITCTIENVTDSPTGEAKHREEEVSGFGACAGELYGHTPGTGADQGAEEAQSGRST